MGRYGNRIVNGRCHWLGQHGLGHHNWRGCWNELNSDDHDDSNWVCRWLEHNIRRDLAEYCVDPNIWNHHSNG